MPLEVKKQERESSQNLVRRFSQRIHKSGILLQAKGAKFFKPFKSKQYKKQTALRKERLRKEYEKLKKFEK